MIEFNFRRVEHFLSVEVVIEGAKIDLGLLDDQQKAGLACALAQASVDILGLLDEKEQRELASDLGSALSGIVDNLRGQL